MSDRDLTEDERREMTLARQRFTSSADSEDLADSLSSLMSIIARLTEGAES